MNLRGQPPFTLKNIPEDGRIGHLKNPRNSSGIESSTFSLVA
jgi:hypothetical protein